MATKKKSSGIGPQHIIVVLLLAAALKFGSDEVAIAAEHGFDGWRRRRFGW